jgi:hypothetical protein
MRVLLALLPLAAYLAGCPGSIDVVGADGFTARSGVWIVWSEGNERSHSLVLSSIDQHCAKARKAEEARIAANQAHQERLTGGTAVCESTDLLYDDLGDAYAPLLKDGAGFLDVTVARDDAGPTTDAMTAPTPGHYAMVGTDRDGTFAGVLRRYHGSYWKAYADAYNCLSPEEIDESNWQQFLAEVEPGLVDVWNLSAGELDIEEDGEDRSVEARGDLLEGTSSVGTLAATFNAKRCEIETVTF